MFKRREGFLNSYGGTKIFFQVWEKPDAKGTLIISHGQGEHSESYHRVVEYLKDDNWSIFAADLRGHGRSEGKRGFANAFDEYCEDYRLFVEKVLHEFRKKEGPVVLLGHSMGGLIQLRTLMDHPDLPATAQVCSSPLLGVAVPVPTWKNRGAQILNQVLPSVTLWNELTNDMLTRDPDVIREFEQDVLRHNRISSGVYLGFLETLVSVHARAGEIKLPTLFQIAEHDPVVSSFEAQKFFENLGSHEKKLIVYGEGSRHEIYNDTHRLQVLGDLKAWLDTFVKGR